MTSPFLLPQQLAFNNDADASKRLGFITVNEGLALQVREIDSTTSSARRALDNRDAFVKVDTSGGAITLTLAYARTWTQNSATRTPFLAILNTGATNNVNLSVQSGDTLSGASVVTPGELLLIVSDGELTWTVVSSNQGTAGGGGPYVNESGDTMTGPLVINSNLTVTGDTQLGNASGDALTIHPNAVTWSNNPTHSGNHTYSGNVVVSGTTTLNGSVFLGDTSGDSIVAAGDVIHANNTQQQWKDTGGVARDVLQMAGDNHVYLSNPVGSIFVTAPTGFSDDVAISGHTIGKGGAIGHHVDAYGAIGDGSTNDAAAIAAAITAALAGTNGSSTVVFGAKTYYSATAQTIAWEGNTLRIFGEGSTGSACTKIEFASGVNGFVFTSDNTNSEANRLGQIHMKGMQILSRGGTSKGLLVGTSGFQIDSHAKHIFEDLFFFGTADTHSWTIGIELVNLRNANFIHCSVRYGTTTGSETALYARHQNTGSGVVCGDVNFIGCELSSRETASGNVLFLYNCANFNFTNCTFYYGDVFGAFIYCDSNLNLNWCGDIRFTGCQFDQMGGTAIYIKNDGTKDLKNVYITDCWMLARDVGSYGVLIEGSSTVPVYNVTITGNHIVGFTSGGVYLGKSVGCTVTGNKFTNIGDYSTTEDYVINVTDTSRTCTVTGNIHTMSTGRYTVTQANQDPANDQFTESTIAGDGDGARVFMNATTFPFQGGGAAFAVDTPYYLVSTSAPNFKLAASAGGAVIPFDTDGSNDLTISRGPNVKWMVNLGTDVRNCTVVGNSGQVLVTGAEADGVNDGVQNLGINCSVGNNIRYTS